MSRLASTCRAAATLSLGLLLALAGCSKPTPHQRVEMQVRKDGTCRLDGAEQPCASIGRQSAQRHTATGVGAVLLIEPGAPASSVQALRTGLQEAGITHVQFSDQVLGSKGNGLD